MTTSPGKTVLEAALESQIYIPYLCYHPGMKPFAACRMCMVREEVEMEVDQDGQKVKQKVIKYYYNDQIWMAKNPHLNPHLKPSIVLMILLV